MAGRFQFRLATLLIFVVGISVFVGLNFSRRIEVVKLAEPFPPYLLIKQGFPFTVRERETDSLENKYASWNEYAGKTVGWMPTDPEDPVPWRVTVSYSAIALNVLFLPFVLFVIGSFIWLRNRRRITSSDAP